MLPREALYLADELFFTGTAAEVSPIRSVDGIPVGAGKRGPITRRLQKAFFGLFNGRPRTLGLARAAPRRGHSLKPAPAAAVGRGRRSPRRRRRCYSSPPAHQRRIRNMGMTAAGARPRRPDVRRARRWLAAGLLAAAWLDAGAARAWQTARIEPRVDNLDELLGACERKREQALDRNREIDAWVAYQAGLGTDVSKQADLARAGKGALPACDSAAIHSRLGATPPAVWAMTVADGRLLYATVNLPLPAVLVSADGGHSWHYRHVFLGGYNVEHAFMLRGIAYRHGLLAVASDDGVLLSTDGGRAFTRALAGQPLWAVAISAASPRRLVAGGDGTSYLSEDGGANWTDLAFSRFTRTLATRNPHRVDHVTAVAFDPDDPRSLYFGSGSHLYRFVLDAASAASGRWQAMEGDAAGRVLDDSTVYNIEIGERFMISTCNGVYYLDRLGDDVSRDQADVSWRKFRDATFSKRGVGGPKGNLRAYFIAGRDFEREIVVKVNTPELARAELMRPRWKREHVALGTNTDPYQWVEKKYELLPAVWEAMRDSRTPSSVLTKSPLLLRDVELFKQIPSFAANLSIPTLDEKAWRASEPHTPHPRKRIEAVAELNQAGIPTGVLIAPLMPGINDDPRQVEEILDRCAEAGAVSIGGICLHLRGEVRGIFMDWLRSYRPDLVERYEKLYARGAYAPKEERERLSRLSRQGRRVVPERDEFFTDTTTTPTGDPVPEQTTLF